MFEVLTLLGKFDRLLLAVCCFVARAGNYPLKAKQFCNHNLQAVQGFADYLFCGQHGCKVDPFFELDFAVTEALASAIPN